MINLKSAQESVIRSLFSIIPFAGQPLSELFYDYRSRIKQDRLNEFSTLLSNYFSNDQVLEFSNLNSVEFSDLFEAVILRVAQTGSKEKHKRFRDILIGYLENPQRQLDHTDTFLELIATLTEPSIHILKFHYVHQKEFSRLDHLQKSQQAFVRGLERKLSNERELHEKGFANDLQKTEADLRSKSKKLQDIEEEQKKLGKYRHAEFYGLDDDDFLYLKQILASRALLTDNGAGATGHVPFRYMTITTFGKNFINYIREH